MADKEIFEKFMSWMGMVPGESKEINSGTVQVYVDGWHSCDPRFTKLGYDEFYAGAVFDENGKIVKAYIDSHVAYSSGNCKAISKELTNTN